MIGLRTKIKKLESLIAAGHLQVAVAEAIDKRLVSQARAASTMQKLVDSLIGQSQRYASSGDFQGAWENLDSASVVAPQAAQDAISKEKSRLVDLTIERAAELLDARKPAQAMRLVSLISSRGVLDRRIESIRQVCQIAAQGDELFSRGKVSRAIELVNQQIETNAYSGFLRRRLSEYERLHSKFNQHNDALAKQLSAGEWTQARESAQQLLRISPDYQIALEAIRRSEFALRQPPGSKPAFSKPDLYIGDDFSQGTHAHSNKNSPAKVSNSTYYIGESVYPRKPDHAGKPPFVDRRPSRNQIVNDIADAELVEQSTDRQGVATAPQTDSAVSRSPSAPASDQSSVLQQRDLKDTQSSNSGAITHVGDSVADPVSIESGVSSLANKVDPIKPFFLWVDGVGGFWVCTKKHICLGSDHGTFDLDIPIRGLPKQSLLTLQRLDGMYLIGRNHETDLKVDETGIESEMLLGKQHLLVAGDLRLQFRKPHVLSSTAVIKFDSSHRTTPWTDGVILMDKSIVLGPDRASHVVCSNWRQQMVIFQRAGKLLVSTNVQYEVDGVICSGQSELQADSRISGTDFAVGLEPMGNTGR